MMDETPKETGGEVPDPDREESAQAYFDAWEDWVDAVMQGKPAPLPRFGDDD